MAAVVCNNSNDTSSNDTSSNDTNNASRGHIGPRRCSRGRCNVMLAVAILVQGDAQGADEHAIHKTSCRCTWYYLA